MLRGYKFRLYPTAAQASAMRQHAGTVRFVYNLALEQREQFGRQYRRITGKGLNFISQGRELNALRDEVDWIEASPRVSLEQALRDLDQAFAAFYAGRSRYPQPRRKGLNDAFRTAGRDTLTKALNAKWGVVLVSKVGWVKFRSTRPLPKRPTNATFSLRAGVWFVSFACEVLTEVVSCGQASVGIDRGVTLALALSNGETFQIPPRLAAIAKRRQKAQRILARRKRGSNRRAAQRAKVASLYDRARRARTDWQQRVTTDIARRFSVVALEALNTKGMTARAPGKRGLNRAILSVGWGQLERMLDYKLETNGGRLVFVDPAYTSQTCAVCGCIDRESRQNQATFRCVHCGHEDNADRNAAVEILRRSTAWLDAEGRHLGRPVEASTLAA